MITGCSVRVPKDKANHCLSFDTTKLCLIYIRSYRHKHDGPILDDRESRPGGA